MVDPTDVINYNRTPYELEEFLLFAICVAGKTASTTAKKVGYFLETWGTKGENPLSTVKRLYTSGKLMEALKEVRFGAYSRIYSALEYLSTQSIDISTCTVDKLEEVPGIGPKTARYFILFTRPDQQVAVLDTHMLKYLSSLGYKVPKSTPSNPKQYRKLEDIFLNEARKSGKSVAEFDLSLWNSYSQRP